MKIKKNLIALVNCLIGSIILSSVISVLFFHEILVFAIIFFSIILTILFFWLYKTDFFDLFKKDSELK